MDRQMIDVACFAAPFEGALWQGVVPRSEALPLLGRRVLLHAGPAFAAAPPAAVRQAAVQAILYEGLAEDVATAQALLAVGEVTLAPAQDHGLATPLAQVVSASMPVAVVGDGHSRAFAPLIEGTPPALRFGATDPAARQRLRHVAQMGFDRLAPVLRRQPVALRPVVAGALLAGDECHGRTGAANGLLLGALDGLTDFDRATLAASPGFVLTVLMAGACWRLRRQTGGIAAVGGNGLQFGARLHGETAWRCLPATPPRGTRLPGHAETAALGAIGDSAVLDFCGLGGQALAAAPALREEWRGVLPDDALQRRDVVLDAATGLVDPARVAAHRRAPLVNLAILDQSGVAGLVGRGFYAPDPALFR